MGSRKSKAGGQVMGQVGRYVGLAGLLVLCMVGLFTMGWTTVHPTEVAVEINKAAGKVIEQPRGVGYHFYNRWITDMVLYRVSARAFPNDSLATEGHQNEWTMSLKTNDGQSISMDLTVLYSLKANEVPALHQQVGPSYELDVLLPQIRSEARLVVGGYNAEQIYQGNVRDEIQTHMRERLAAALSKYPAIVVQDTLIRDFRFSPEFEKAIESKKLASQQVEINKNLALAQEEEAKRQEAESRGSKLQAVQGAEGRAQSARIEADAERYKLEQEAAGKLALYKSQAEGQRLLAEALGGGQNVVALKFAEQIPSKLQIWGIPTGNSSTTLMDLNGVFGDMLGKKR